MDEARRAPEEESHSLSKAYSTSTISLKRRINEAVPVAVIPPEVLAETFAYLPGAWHQPMDFEWLAVTHVCHHWREVALNTPRLWTRINLHKNLDILQEYLARSKQAPLEVTGGGYNTHTCLLSPQICLVLSEIHRIQAWDLFMSHEVLVAVTKSLIHSSTTYLKVLQVTCDATSCDPDGEEEDSDFLSTLFASVTMPSLENLFLEVCTLDWSNTVLPLTLTSLTVTGGTPGTTADVVRAVSGLPLLERLNLFQVIHSPPESEMSVLPIATYHLSHLKELTITAPSLPCLHFINHFTYPASATLSLDLDAPCAPLPLLVAGLYRQIPQQRAGVLEIGRNEVSLFQNDEHFSDKKVPAAFVVRGEALWDDGNGAISNAALGDVIAQLPFQSISSLRIAGSAFGASHYQEEGWTKLLRALINVAHVDIEQNDMARQLTNFLTLLQPLPRVPLTQSQPNPVEHLIPKLRRISFAYAKFRDEEIQSDDDFAIVTQLSAALKSREEAGRAIEEVRIRNCVRMDVRDINLLRNSVAVDWTGTDYDREEGRGLGVQDV